MSIAPNIQLDLIKINSATLELCREGLLCAAVLLIANYLLGA